jgi:hypothetical protein
MLAVQAAIALVRFVERGRTISCLLKREHDNQQVAMMLAWTRPRAYDSKTRIYDVCRILLRGITP